MFNFSELKKRNLLSNESMSAIRGGSVGSCGYETSADHVECGVSKETAMEELAKNGGGHWCCDSCMESSYCGGGDFMPAVVTAG